MHINKKIHEVFPNLCCGKPSPAVIYGICSTFLSDINLTLHSYVKKYGKREAGASRPGGREQGRSASGLQRLALVPRSLFAETDWVLSGKNIEETKESLRYRTLINTGFIQVGRPKSTAAWRS